MKKWEISLKTDENFHKKIELFDAKRYFDGYLKIKRTYFNSLLKTIKTSKNYKVIKAIDKIKSDDQEWTLNPWILLIIKDNEKEKSFWFLIKREKDLSGLLVAIGPKEFSDYNYNNSENKREIMRIINYIIAYMNKFNCMVVLPTYINNNS
ncbi:MAG: hypothetical protein ACQERB_11265 [Promethearchaeati archaeon]